MDERIVKFYIHILLFIHIFYCFINFLKLIYEILKYINIQY